MIQLRCLEVRKRVRTPLRELRENWPADWAVPVPDSAYAALAECLVNDPEGQVEDWSSLQDQLDAHQAQYCLGKALAGLPNDRVSWAEIESVLVDALSLAPDLWLTAAPLFGLLGSHNGQSSTKTGPEVRVALEAAAGRLLPESGVRPEALAEHRRHNLFHRANALLDKGFRELRGDARRFVRLWHCLEKTLAPALAAAGEEVIAEIEALAKTCLDHWPTGQTDVPTRADPRNPVRIFLESCEKARCLAQAERLLGEQPPALKQAKGSITRALCLGLDTAEESKRAAAAIYLIEYSREDAAPAQRQVLARLDEWVESAVIDVKRFTGQDSIMTALVAIRADVLVTPSTLSAERTDATDHSET
jgi:hypothetical protein